MTPREEAVPPVAVPACLLPLVQDYQWGRDLVGEAGASVHRLHAAGRPTLYLKAGTGAAAEGVADEMARLAWLRDRLPVPTIRHFTWTPDAAWLLTTAMPGRTAYQEMEDAPARRAETVSALAGFLRRVHSLPADECPFNAAHPLRLARARARMAAGEVDEGDFGDDHRGWSAKRVWEEMIALLPFPPDPAVTHGDFSLDNILMDKGVVTGVVDVGLVGVADRYQDLAILAECLTEFDEGWDAALFRAYGVDRDERKRRFHLCLDEFF